MPDTLNQRATILIVDDLAANRETLLELLDSPEYRLFEAADGAIALRAAQELAPDLILLDVMMPQMDGFEVCRRLRADARLAEVPVIMVTALDDQSARLAGIEAGADDFITKPFNRAELRARVRSITRLNRYARLNRERVKVQEASLRIRELAALLEQARDAIYVRSLEQGITYWNHGAIRLYGWTAEEALGHRSEELTWKDGQAAREEIHRLILEKGEWTGELCQVSKSGKEITVESRRTLLRDEQDRPKSILIIDTDITERKQVERQMLRAQRLDSIGTLAGGVAHDLNNSLTPILMATELLRMRYPDGTQLIDTIETSARRGSEMVRQLLTFARGVEGARLLIQPVRLLKEMEKLIRNTFPKNIQLRAAYAKELRTIVGDSTQLHQVLLNLCVNARDAMPEGGTLTLEAENVRIESVDAGLPDAKPGEYVIWRVTDSGTGISPQTLEHIFEPFFSTKGPEKGTGLGLSTVIGIIKGHGGFIRVASTPGQGSAFSVYLPAESETSSEPATLPPSGTSFRGDGETILVVDDEPAVREITRKVLAALNFQVITSRNGTEALIQVTEKRTKLRAVITDVQMPHMNGLVFVRVLKNMLPEAGIIVATGRLDEETVNDFRSLGVSAFLDKPFSQEKLVEALEAVFTETSVTRRLLTLA